MHSVFDALKNMVPKPLCHLRIDVSTADLC